MIRSPEVTEGAAYSRSQPDFNLRLVEGTQLTGINTTKLLEFMQGDSVSRSQPIETCDSKLRRSGSRSSRLMRIARSRIAKSTCHQYVNPKNIVEMYSGPRTENAIPPVRKVLVLMVLGAHGSIITGTVAGNQLQL